MTSAGLPRRVERTEEDLLAISDTVLDIKEVVDRHTGSLVEIQAEVVGINTRLDTLETRFDTLETRFDTLGTRFDTLGTRFDTLGTRFDTLQTRLDSLETGMTEGFAQILRRLDQR